MRPNDAQGIDELVAKNFTLHISPGDQKLFREMDFMKKCVTTNVKNYFFLTLSPFLELTYMSHNFQRHNVINFLKMDPIDATVQTWMTL